MMPGASSFELAFRAPVFRGLDQRALQEISAAGKIRALRAGEVLFRPGDSGDSFCVVVSGNVDISTVHRGHDVQSQLRVASAGDLFGEEAILSSTRRTEARAIAPAVVAEVPVHLYRRAASRVGKADVLSRFERTLQRNLASDLLSSLAFGQGLERSLFEALLDRLQHQDVARGQAIYRQGEPCLGFYIVAEGVVELAREDDVIARVRAFVTRGDVFGDEDTETASPRSESAIASGPTTVFLVPLDIARTLHLKAPNLLRSIRRIATAQDAARGNAIGSVAKHATQHIFQDLYRFQIARSLLVIDQDVCVRCGHCAWACADVHGTSRLIRRGDKIVTRAPDATASVFALGLEPSTQASHLLVPNSCQHCETPSCMIDCPTGAIGKDPTGEVFIRPELCTGCGACARACPWDNIQMAPRPKDVARPPRLEADVIAEKCDLCREFVEGPACVRACPVDAVFRIDPEQDLGELREFLGSRAPSDLERSRPKWGWLIGSVIASIGIVVVSLLSHGRNNFTPSSGVGYAAGVATALLFVALLAYVLPKRIVRLRMTRKNPSTTQRAGINRVRSTTSRHATAHVAIGILAASVSLAHQPPAFTLNSLGQALSLAFMLSALSGLLTGLAYAIVPARLTRLERSALLPEDISQVRETLVTALFRGLTGKNELIKKVAETVLLPYQRATWGAFALVFSGRTLRQEEAVLRQRVDQLLQGRGRDQLAGLSDLTRTVVELRALPAVRSLLFALRGLLVMHVIAVSITIPLLVLHVWQAWR